MDKKENGLREGMARALTQACIYGMEAKKTLLQVHGKIPKFPPKVIFQRWTNGMLTSTVTSGIVFGTYFSVYNPIQHHWYAGTAAALTTSIIKIPISNGMRLMQSGCVNNIFAAGRKIITAHTWKGLYTGYGLSLLEDIIELDLRARIYRAIRKEKDFDMKIGIYGGAVSGSVAACITTPFDTLRAHMAVNASKQRIMLNTMQLTRKIVKDHGVAGLYRGAGMRMLSNAVKGALFYSIYEMLPPV